jgi:hypothetical protein
MRCDVMTLGTRIGRELLWEQVPVLGFPQLGFGSSTVLEELCTAAGGGGEATAAAGAMPPKPAAAKGGKEKSKADLAKKQKLVEDKTFGLKNKNKSKNVQKFVQSLTQSVQPNPKQTDAKAALKVRCSFLCAPFSLSLSLVLFFFCSGNFMLCACNAC